MPDDAATQIAAALDQAIQRRNEEHNPRRADQSAAWFRAEGEVVGLSLALDILTASTVPSDVRRAWHEAREEN